MGVDVGRDCGGGVGVGCDRVGVGVGVGCGRGGDVGVDPDVVDGGGFDCEEVECRGGALVPCCEDEVVGEGLLPGV